MNKTLLLILFFAQVLLWTTGPVKEARIGISEFKSARGNLPASIVSARFVRYVMTLM